MKETENEELQEELLKRDKANLQSVTEKIQLKKSNCICNHFLVYNKKRQRYKLSWNVWKCFFNKTSPMMTSTMLTFKFRKESAKMLRVLSIPLCLKSRNCWGLNLQVRVQEMNNSRLRCQNWGLNLQRLVVLKYHSLNLKSLPHCLRTGNNSKTKMSDVRT